MEYQMLRYAFLALVPSMAFAGVGGDPESTTPEPHKKPHVWVETTNDGFAPRDHDDGLTYVIKGGADIYGALVGADFSAYTHRVDGSVTNGSRADELTLTVGERVYEDTNTTVAVAPGLCLTGDFGGETLQDKWHHAEQGSDRQYHLTKQANDWEPVLVIDARHTFWFATGYGAIQPQVSIEGTNHSFEFEARLPLLYVSSDLGGDAVMWIGPGYRDFRGKALSVAKQLYEEEARGPILVMGVRLQAFTAELCLSANRQYGGFGFSF